MATWTRSEDADFITFSRADGLAGYRIYKHSAHLHAEQWMPWAESPKTYPSLDADGLAAWFADTLAGSGDTVV